MSKNETKNERFRRVATRRTNEILEKIRILGNCANKSAYSYTQEEINKIFNVIESSSKEARAQFHFSMTREFKL